MVKKLTSDEKKRLAQIEDEMKSWTPAQWEAWDSKQAEKFKQQEDDDLDSLLTAMKKVKS